MALKILSTCSSRGRPERCKEMIESFIATRQESATLFIYVDTDDPKSTEYYRLCNEYNWGDPVCVECGPYKNLIEVLNYGPERFPDMDYYHEVNDDHIFRTVGWDTKLAQALEGRMGISYGQTDNLPSSIMMSGELVRRLGYFAYPGFTHSWVDNFFYQLGQDVGCLQYVPDVLIEHMHWAYGKAPRDEIYEKVITEQNSIENIRAYYQWLSERRETVRRVLNG